MKGMVFTMAAIVAMAVARMAGGAYAQGANPAAKARRQLTPEERAALHERIAMRRSGGGIVRKEGSAKGAFAVRDAQTKVGEDGIRPALEYIDGKLAARTVYARASGLSTASIAERIREAGGTMGVGLVDDASLPSLIVAPETGWAVVNVSKLDERCHGPGTLASRVRKEILRSLAFVTGCAYATMADPLMRDVTRPGDVDALQSEEFGFELINRFASSAPLYGLKPWYCTTYKRACEEGWAPAPTNDVQRAIWEKVHELPAAPIKIKPETRKVAE